MNSAAEDLIYNHVFKELINDGYRQDHAEQAGATAIRKYRRNTPHKNAIKYALAECRKAHKRVKK